MISGDSRKVQLRGGGSLSVRLEGLSWMHFDEDERALVSAIADAMHAYEQKRRKDPPVADDAERTATEDPALVGQDVDPRYYPSPDSAVPLTSRTSVPTAARLAR